MFTSYPNAPTWISILSTRTVLAFGFALFGLSAPYVMAQMGAMGGMSMADMEPIPAPDKLPTALHMTGIGNSHMTITAKPEAQAWFDQGLNLLHDFWDYESAKAFEQGIRADPECAMCYWGLYKAQEFRTTEAHTYALTALSQAKKFKHNVSKAEKIYLEIAELEAADNLVAKQRELLLMRKLVKRNPKDVQARIFLAGKIDDGYDEKGVPKPGTLESISLLENILRDYPNDSAANHYWIHMMEEHHPERALASALLLPSLAPNSGHMVHMPGHIYYRLGRYAEAEHWFAASTAVDEEYMRVQHVRPDDDWNYVHNLMYAAANFMEEGKIVEANTASDQLSGARGHLSSSLYVHSSRDQIARISNRLPVALRIGDWKVVLSLLSTREHRDAQNAENLTLLAKELTEYASGMEALENDDLALARSASDRLDASLWRVDRTHRSDDVSAPKTKPALNAGNQTASMRIMPDGELDPIVTVLTIVSLQLRAGILVQQKDLVQASSLYKQARETEQRLPYHEPPTSIIPVSEVEGAALLKAGDYSGARLAYATALAARPESGFAMYGIAHSEELSGDTSSARRDYATFLRAWRNANPDLPEVVSAHRFLGSTGLREGGSN